jgi:DNA-binding NarL/FixJ family response regulator/DNA-binding transcriptional ArsR family regulator
LLEPLGIPADAEALYIVLASLDEADPEQLAERAALPSSRVRAHLDTLADLGLALAVGEGRWRTLPLADVVKGLRVRRLAEVEAAAIAAETLQNQLLAASQDGDDDIRVVMGREAVVLENFELCSRATREICIFDKPPYAEQQGVTEEELSDDAPEWQAMGRGVVLRSIYHPGFDADRLQELMLFAAKGEQARTASVPMKLVLFDGQTALIPSMPSYLPGHEIRASVVRHPLMVESLHWLFEAVWDSSIPITAGKYLDSDPRRQMLVSLMMSGSTDDAIANQLGINVRSVRRWIAELMDELGVTTRLQLGAALVRAQRMRPPG